MNYLISCLIVLVCIACPILAFCGIALHSKLWAAARLYEADAVHCNALSDRIKTEILEKQAVIAWHDSQVKERERKIAARSSSQSS